MATVGVDPVQEGNRSALSPPLRLLLAAPLAGPRPWGMGVGYGLATCNGEYAGDSGFYQR